MESFGEFRRVSGLISLYLEGDVGRDAIRSELEVVDERMLEMLSRTFSVNVLKSFFRWRGILGEHFENMEFRNYIKRGLSVPFYLACVYEGIYMSSLHGEARELYKAGETNVEFTGISFNR